MKLWVAVLGFRGLIDEVKVFASEESAMERVEVHLGDSGYSSKLWFQYLKRNGSYPDEDYDPTNIYEVEIDGKLIGKFL